MHVYIHIYKNATFCKNRKILKQIFTFSTAFFPTSIKQDFNFIADIMTLIDLFKQISSQMNSKTKGIIMVIPPSFQYDMSHSIICDISCTGPKTSLPILISSDEKSTATYVIKLDIPIQQTRQITSFIQIFSSLSGCTITALAVIIHRR